MLWEVAEGVAFAFLAAGAGASDDVLLDDWRVEAIYTKHEIADLEDIRIGNKKPISYHAVSYLAT